MRANWGVIVLFLPLALACTGGGEGTAADTQILSWTRSSYTTLEDVQLEDDVGDATSESKVIVFTPRSRGMCDPSYDDVRLRLDFECGEVGLLLKEGTHVVARRVEATLLDNDAWDVEGECEPMVLIPLDEPIGAVDAALPRVFITQCQVTLRRREDARIVSIRVSGDGQVEVSAGFDEARVE